VVNEHLGAAARKLSAITQVEEPAFLIFAWHIAEAHIDFAPWRRINGAREPAHSGRRKHTMTLRMRLNVLAAIVSFAFLTAIVVGML
jgi:hypothetical protein